MKGPRVVVGDAVLLERYGANGLEDVEPALVTEVRPDTGSILFELADGVMGHVFHDGFDFCGTVRLVAIAEDA